MLTIPVATVMCSVASRSFSAIRRSARGGAADPDGAETEFLDRSSQLGRQTSRSSPDSVGAQVRCFRSLRHSGCNSGCCRDLFLPSSFARRAVVGRSLDCLVDLLRREQCDRLRACCTCRSRANAQCGGCRDVVPAGCRSRTCRDRPVRSGRIRQCHRCFRPFALSRRAAQCLPPAVDRRRRRVSTSLARGISAFPLLARDGYFDRVPVGRSVAMGRGQSRHGWNSGDRDYRVRVCRFCDLHARCQWVHAESGTVAS